MKKYSKIISSLCLITIVIGAITGCGTTSESSAHQVSPSPTTERIAPADAKFFEENDITLPEGWDQLHFNQVLVKNPEIFHTFSPYLAKTVSHSILDPVDREILIFRTCSITGETYEKTHHLNIAKNAGMTDEKIQAAENADATVLNEHEMLLCKAADELVSDFCLSDETFEALSAIYSDEEIIELTSVVASYVDMAMYTRSFGVQLEDEELFNSFQNIRNYQ